MQKKNFLPILALAVGHLVTDLQAGALPIVLYCHTLKNYLH